ncbi:MAG: tetratricopeptide (TPR) repeat protein [Flammeovirgaceae bacterium]|jgi:tetratricopeptide (TPR) repeat protein
MIGEKAKAIQIIRKQIEKDISSVGSYGYLHLGVLHLENSDYDKAINAFEKQSNIN